MREKTLDLTVDEWMGMYHIAADRADKAEAEVERLKKVYAITNESWKKQVEENAQLRKVADAARAYLKGGYNETLDELVLTVLELDKEGE